MGKALRAIEIFRSGTWRPDGGQPLSFTDDDLRAIAEAYDPKTHEAPIVIGHPKHNSPAFGWIESVSAAGGGVLRGQPKQVDPQFAEWVRAGRVKKVSASFYVPGSPSNPKPGAYYLRHVGFLGAAAPAVRGLAYAAFADGEEGVVEFSLSTERSQAGLWRRLREWMIGAHGTEAADRVIPGWEVSSLEEESAREEITPGTSFSELGAEPDKEEESMLNQQAELAKKEKELAEKEAALAAKDVEFSERAKELDAKDAKAHCDEVAQFVEGLVTDDCRVLPADKEPLVGFMSALPADAVVEFTEGDGKGVTTTPSLEWFKDFLQRLPKQVDFSERAPGAVSQVDSTDPAALAEAAQRYRTEQAAAGVEVRLSDAVRHVAR